jgi:sugar phosphate isomerase/epimerase
VRTIPDILRVLAGAGNPAGAGICVDAGHANISGLSAAEMIRQAGPLLIETHFNDNFGWLSTENAINDIHRPPGVGTVDWVAVVDALDQIGYSRPVIFELGPKFEEDTVDSFIYLALENWRQFERICRFHRGQLPQAVATPSANGVPASV